MLPIVGIHRPTGQGSSGLMMIVWIDTGGCHVGKEQSAMWRRSAQCILLTCAFCPDRNDELKHFFKPLQWAQNMWRSGVLKRVVFIETVVRRCVASESVLLGVLSFGVPRVFVSINREFIPKRYTFLTFLLLNLHFVFSRPVSSIQKQQSLSPACRAVVLIFWWFLRLFLLSADRFHQLLDENFLVSPFFFSVALIFLFLFIALSIAIGGCFGIWRSQLATKQLP